MKVHEFPEQISPAYTIVELDVEDIKAAIRQWAGRYKKHTKDYVDVRNNGVVTILHNGEKK